MQAIILAAGVGERLGAATAGKPKSLLEMGDTSLLLRHCRALRALGIDMIHVVTGFSADLIDAEIATLPDPARIHRMINKDFRLGSVISLWTARDVLRSGEPVILMDADVLCDTRILARLAGTSVANCFLLDRDFDPGDEPVKLCVRDGQIVEFRKQLAAGLECDLQGESVGFFRFAPAMAAALAARCEEYVSQGLVREPYEEAIRDLVLGAPAEFGYEDITGLPWIEIDFPGDVARARDEILPRISA
ncbi:MAG: ADP-glucose pyrophosphorylase [Gammaproteobacteria bacterium RIFCSPLOWO2_02_FULL_61_13]|nr:MAG: ADP-glucose pyrophosphorylase [Gammaproteobacteria bacterium RIFCSPLOWO2_02_FULL_61_13]